MLTSELEYELPEELIAQEPAERRDGSRLLVLDRDDGRITHTRFSDLPAVLPAKSLLVMNDTRVLPARLHMRRRTGGHVSGLFLHQQDGRWEVMVTGAGRLKAGEELLIDGATRRLRLLERVEAGTWRAEPVPPGDTLAILSECGHPPLPPYIRRDEKQGAEAEPQAAASGSYTRHDERIDVERYQTIYARVPGAVAAPTAGLHFTPEVFDRVRAAGSEHRFVTLHVGVGTFAPIRCENLADHPMHEEWYECPTGTADAVSAARRGGRPIVAVGTTSVRVLETCAGDDGAVRAGTGSTRVFIHPPYRFKAVDHMITNFHLPGSTLLAMVFAFAGRELMLRAYDEAIRERYRFYSYGDAMLIR